MSEEQRKPIMKMREKDDIHRVRRGAWQYPIPPKPLFFHESLPLQYKELYSSLIWLWKCDYIGIYHLLISKLFIPSVNHQPILLAECRASRSLPPRVCWLVELVDSCVCLCNHLPCGRSASLLTRLHICSGGSSLN